MERNEIPIDWDLMAWLEEKQREVMGAKE